MSDHLPVPEPPNPDGDDFLADLRAELGAPPRDDRGWRHVGDEMLIDALDRGRHGGQGLR